LHFKSDFIVNFIYSRNLLGLITHVEKKYDCCADFSHGMGPVYIYNFASGYINFLLNKTK